MNRQGIIIYRLTNSLRRRGSDSDLLTESETGVNKQNGVTLEWRGV